MENKPTVIFGASDNPERYAFRAASLLKSHGLKFIPIGMRKGEVFGEQILDMKTKPEVGSVDTITLYVNALNQREWYPYLLSLKPRRIIFNPGTENPELEALAANQGVITEQACTLVLLSTGQY